MDSELETKLLEKADDVSAELSSREFALAMDAEDPIRHLRELFHYPKMGDLPHVDPDQVNVKEDSVYFCGNSLGLCPKNTRDLVCKEIDRWSKQGVYGHRSGDLPWALCDLCVDEQMAALVGARREEVAVMNGVTVNLHLLMVISTVIGDQESDHTPVTGHQLSFYEPTSARHKILLESKAFPSDHYVVESQIRLQGFDPETSMLCLEPQQGEECLKPEDILKVIEEEGDSIAVIMLSGVQYYTGQLFDMAAITLAGHRKGIIVGFDLAHAVGNVPLELHNWGVDFACWCTYKYLCSGAGGIGGAFIHNKHATTVKPKLHGWWGHKDESRFNMDNQMDLIPGVQGYRLSNPSGLLCASLKASLDVYSLTSLGELRTKSLLLTGYLEWLIRHHFSRQPGSDAPYIDILTPSDPSQRGCQLSLCFSIPISKIFKDLTRNGIVADERMPSVIRIAPVHLYNSFEDVYRFVEIVRRVLGENSG